MEESRTAVVLDCNPENSAEICKVLINHRFTIVYAYSIDNLLNVIDFMRPKLITIDASVLNDSHSTTDDILDALSETHYILIHSMSKIETLDSRIFSRSDISMRMPLTNLELESFLGQYDNAVSTGNGLYDEKALNNTITDLLYHFGLLPKFKGFYYIRAALSRIICGEDSTDLLTKVLYPSIAKEFSTSSCAVEKSIRYAFSKIFDSCNFEMFSEIGICYRKYTNSEFLFLLSEYVSREYKKQNS